MEYISLWKNPPLFDKEYENINPENKNCPTLTPFLVNDGAKHPAVIVVPGGGYTHRATEKKIKVSQKISEWGINVFMLNYRVNPYMHPAELIDCRRAVRFVKYYSEKYNVDREKISLIGFSAGAHLAALSVLVGNKYDIASEDPIDKEDTFVHSIALCYPVTSLCAEYAHKGSGDALLGDDEETKKLLSIENMDISNMPPAFMWHTFEDKSVPIYNSLEMAKMLKKNNIPFEYHVFPRGPHGSALAEDIEGTNKWPLLYKDWLTRIKFIPKS